jgi:hypothetical protein
VVHVCNPNTQEAKAEGSQVQGQSGPHRETLSQKEKNMIKCHHYYVRKRNRDADYLKRKKR